MFKFSRKGISVSTVLDRRRVKVNGKYPVKIEVVWNRKQKYFPTGVDMTEDQWNKASAGHKHTEELEAVEEYYSHVRNEVAEMLSKDCFSFRMLELRMGRPHRFNVNKAMRSMIEECRKEGRTNSYFRYRSTLLNLEKYAGGSIAFTSITPEWLKRCEEFWMQDGKSATTVSIYMKTMKSVMNKAVEEGYLSSSAYPFGRGGYTVPKSSVRKLALSKNQIKQLIDYSGPEMLEMYRDLWVFSYLCNGINFRDMLFLRYSDIVDGEICFVRSKTRYAYGGQKIIKAVLAPKMAEIISRWGNERTSPDTLIFKFAKGSEDEYGATMLVRRVVCKCNTALKQIALELGIPAFTTYSARHSFATIMQRNGAGIPFISECLGHSSLAMTETYLAGFGKEERLRNAPLLTDFD